jgi:hypothetical protein
MDDTAIRRNQPELRNQFLRQRADVKLTAIDRRFARALRHPSQHQRRILRSKRDAVTNRVFNRLLPSGMWHII